MEFHIQQCLEQQGWFSGASLYGIPQRHPLRLSHNMSIPTAFNGAPWLSDEISSPRADTLLHSHGLFWFLLCHSLKPLYPGDSSSLLDVSPCICINSVFSALYSDALTSEALLGETAPPRVSRLLGFAHYSHAWNCTFHRQTNQSRPPFPCCNHARRARYQATRDSLCTPEPAEITSQDDPILSMHSPHPSASGPTLMLPRAPPPPSTKWYARLHVSRELSITKFSFKTVISMSLCLAIPD